MAEVDPKTGLEIVRLALEADEGGMITGRRFDKKLILGPAIIAPLSDFTLANNVFEGDPEALFLEVPEGKRVIGVIGLSGVTFENCQFRLIGLSGIPESVAQFRAGFG